jgi:hypothetical protein
LQRLYGQDNNVVLLLQLEIALRKDPGAYFAEMDTLFQLPFTDLHQKAIMHHIYHLRKLNPQQVRQSLKHCLVERLAIHANEGLIENLLSTLVWMSTSPAYANETAILEDVFSAIHQVWTKSLSTGTVQGILVFLWKQIQKLYSGKEYGDAAAWCRLALHQLLSGRVEYANAGTIQRYGNIRANSKVSDLTDKIQEVAQCLLKQFKLEEARDAAMKMSPNVIRHPLSLYLTCCIAIQLSDENMGNLSMLADESEPVLI